jgi:hypothetical protein
MKGHVMKKLVTITLLFYISAAPVAFAQGAKNTPPPFPPMCINDTRLTGQSLKALRKEIRDLTGAATGTPESQDAYSNCVIAELMKRVGDSRAESHYQKAIDAEDAEPEYELLYADYLRNFRGPQRPLFPQAERHYLEALRKLRQLQAGKRWNHGYDELRARVERGLVALYQEDGLPLLYKSDQTGGKPAVERPFMFFSSFERAARSSGDFERVDDVRSFTSEALFASSRQRLNRPLSRDELTRLLRPKQQFETFNRVRFRYKEWPVLDIFQRDRHIEDAQITNFFRPGEFNDFRLREFGVAVEKPFAVSPYFDLYLRGLYKRSERRGLIEFLPGNKEHVNHYEANAAVSRFVGPDKATLEATYVYQDINPGIPNPPQRDRQIIAGTFTYQLFRPLSFLDQVYRERFRPRGIHLFSGVVFDKESFGAVDIKKQDFFVGASVRGLGRVDLTLQPTLFKARVTGDASQSHSQYRTNFNLLYRILDEESEPGLPEKKMGVRWAFVHLVAPFKHDVALNGLKDFENFDAGLQLDTKFFVAGHRRTTFLASFRYNYQRFYRLDKNLNLFAFDLGMGF